MLEPIKISQRTTGLYYCTAKKDVRRPTDNELYIEQGASVYIFKHKNPDFKEEDTIGIIPGCGTSQKPVDNTRWMYLDFLVDLDEYFIYNNEGNPILNSDWSRRHYDWLFLPWIKNGGEYIPCKHILDGNSEVLLLNWGPSLMEDSPF